MVTVDRVIYSKGGDYYTRFDISENNEDLKRLIYKHNQYTAHCVDAVEDALEGLNIPSNNKLISYHLVQTIFDALTSYEE